MVGNATCTTVMSTISMNWANASSVNISQRRGTCGADSCTASGRSTGVFIVSSSRKQGVEPRHKPNTAVRF